MLRIYVFQTFHMPHGASYGPTKHLSMLYQANTQQYGRAWARMWLQPTPAIIERSASRRKTELWLLLRYRDSKWTVRVALLKARKRECSQKQVRCR